MEAAKYKGTVHSFWSLLRENKIEIPIIQRDYAQGRAGQTELRNRFLNALHSSIADDKFIRLDFIYGSQENEAFLPLDGQQRLTTLYLLHWYAALKDGKLVSVKDTLKRFTYETRASSREFCNGLIENTANLNLSLDTLSPSIMDSHWFFLSWKNDPTIDSMLRAIDDIHQKFNDVENIWDKLTRAESAIGFYHVELEDIGLTDDLYIKMNARGKLLTPFENFKASFQKYIKDNNWEEGVSFQQTFANKIDGTWTDLFWNHRKNDRIDDAFMRFISTIAMISLATEKVSPDRLTIINRLQGNPDLLRIENFSENGFKYLIRCLDLYANNVSDFEQLKLSFPFWQHEAKEDFFCNLVYENASYTQKTLFFAQTEYLLRVDNFEIDKYRDWMRVIRNLVSRGDVTRSGDRPAIVRSQQQFDGMASLINELATGCSDIYTFLTTAKIRSTFAREQIMEETGKAKLMLLYPNMRESIHAAEDTNLFMGRIQFALFCCNYRLGYESEFTEEQQSDFKRVVTVIQTHFDKEVTNKIRRGLLATKSNSGSFDYYTYWWSFSFAVDANKRCLIDKFREVEYYIYGEYKDSYYFRVIFKTFINNLTSNSIDELLENFIAPPEMPNWQQRLIKEPKLLDKCKSNYIAIPADESCCYLLPTMRPRNIDACIMIN